MALLLATAGAQADYFAGGYYTPVSGKVGERMLSDAAFDVGDLPPSCLVAWKTISVSGTLPPGISPPGANATVVNLPKDENGIPQVHAEVPDIPDSAFFGTPSKAGDWPVTVTIHGLSCSETQSYGDRTIKINFHIAP
jgi:hypothetical protein